MSSFYVVKAMLLPPNNYAFTSQYLCFYLPIAMLLPPNSYTFTQKYHFPVIFISFFRDYYIQKILLFLTIV